MRIPKALLRRHYDVPMAKIGIAISIGLFVLLLLNPTRAILLVAAPLALIMCTLWLITRQKVSVKMIQSSNSLFLVFTILFFVLFTVLVFIYYTREAQYVRPPAIFLLISILASLLAAEIVVSKKTNVPIILFQIIALAIFIIWSQIGLFPSPTGIDPLFHERVVNDLMDTGHIPIYSQYVDSPFFHIIISSTELVADTDYILSAFFSVSVIQVVSLLLFTQILVSRIDLNHIIGLLSGLVLILSPLVIQANVSAIPFSLATVFMMLLFSLILNQRMNSSRILLISVVFIAINLTHPMVSAFSALVLLSFSMLEIMYRHLAGQKKSWRPTLLIPIMFAAIMVIWWVFFSGYYDVLSGIIQNFVSTNPFRAHEQFIQVQMNDVPMGEQIFNYFSFFLFVSIGLYGILYAISEKGNRVQFAYSLTAIIPLAIGLILMVAGLNLLNERWLYFAQVLLAIPIAISLVCWLSIIKWQIPRVIVVVVLLFILTFGSVTSTFANIDNASYTPNMNMRYAFMTSEISATDFLKAIDSDIVCTDTYYSAMISNSGRQANDFSDMLWVGNFSSCNIVLVRDHVMANTFDRFGAPARLSYDLSNYITYNDFSRIYCSNSVYGYIKMVNA